MTAAATTGPDARAEALRRALRARRLRARRAVDPAAGRAVPRHLGRGHPPPHVPHHRSGRQRALPAPGPHHPGVARLSRLRRGRRGGRLLLSRPGVPPSRRGAGRVRAGRHRILRAPRHRRRRRRDVRARAGGHRALRHRGAGDPHGRCRAVRRADRRARSGARLEAPPGEGLQPHRRASRTISISSSAQAALERPDYQGVLAAMAGSDPKAAHALVTDLLSIAGINAVGGRSIGEIADRFLEQAALGASSGLPRATRALIEQFLAISGRSGRGRRRAAHARVGKRARSRQPRSTCSKAAPVSSPRRASRSRASNSPPRSGAGSITTPASCSSCTTRRSASRASSSPAGAMTGC